MITTDLGSVTAYAEAVAQGYTGTKEEFGKLLANYAQTAEKVAEDKAAAEQAMESAKVSAGRANTSEQNAKASELAAAEQAKNVSDNITELVNKKEEALQTIGDKTAESVNAVKKQEEASVQNVTNHTDSEIQRLTQETAESKTSLDGSIATANDTKSQVDVSVEAGKKLKADLDKSIADSGKAKTALDGSVTAANASKSALDETVGQAKTLDTSLSGKIAEGTQLNKDITASGQKAVNDINSAGAAKLDAVNKAAESIVADREQIAKNKTDIASLNEDLGDVIDKQENLWTYGDVVNSYKANAQYQSKYYDIKLDDGEYYFKYDNVVGAVAGDIQFFPYGKSNGIIGNIIPPNKSRKFSPKNGGVRIRFFSTLTNVDEKDGVATWSGIKLVKGTNIVNPSIKESALPDFYKTLPTAIPKIEEEKANGKGISFSINESGGLRVTYDDGK